MPYIIETTPRGPFKGETSDQYNMRVWASARSAPRTAVSTLEQARQMIFESQEIDPRGPHAPWTGDVMALPESGGTVGPLPDGTVIEVRPVTFMALQCSLPNTTEYLTLSPAGLVAAFNAA